MNKLGKDLGLRGLAKLVLNSFYGEFCHKVNVKSSTYITEPNSLYQLLTKCMKGTTDFHTINEAMVAKRHSIKSFKTQILRLMCHSSYLPMLESFEIMAPNVNARSSHVSV